MFNSKKMACPNRSVCTRNDDFTKLGYTAGAIVECLPQFREVANKTNKSNMLSEVCKLYVESEYVTWKSLANFTYKVTMPFLNCVELSDQNDLVLDFKEIV